MPQASAPLKAKGDSSQQRVLWMGLFVPGLEGRRGLNYCLVGEPGTVKTSIVRWLARMAGIAFEPVLGSIRTPMDYLGVPVPQRMPLGPHNQYLDPDGGSEFLYMHYAPAGFAVRACMAQRSLLLFDEANTMTPAVQSAMLRVLFEGVVGETELPRGTRMMLAMNAKEDAPGGWDLPPAFNNRIGWLNWEGTTAAKFSSYLIGSGGRGSGALPVEPVDPAAYEAEVDARWPSAWAQAIAQVTGFLQRKPDMLHKKPDAASKQRAWPSSRTWDMMTHALAGSFVFDLAELERQTACAAFIGDGAYGEFFTWTQANDLPDCAALLDGQATFEHSAARLDRTAAVMSGCASLVLPTDAERRIERTGAMWNLVHDLMLKHPGSIDVCLPPVAQMCQARLMLGNPESFKVLAKVEPMMAAAGLSAGDMT